MPRRKTVRAGLFLLFVITGSLSCGNREPTEPALPSALNAPALPENFETSAQRESRELLIDGRATDIEWTGTGNPAYVIARGDGGNFFVLVRSLWSYDARFGAPRGIYFLLQWPDKDENRLEAPLETNLDTGDEDGHSTLDCQSDNRVIAPASWHRGTRHEDQVVVEIYSDSQGGYPADKWRWGAGTTDPAVPVNPTEFNGADSTEIRGFSDHPTGGSVEDYYNVGNGWVPDEGVLPDNPNTNSVNDVPLFKADKATRDVRLNRNKPTAYVVWRKVATALAPCDSLNPIRVDDASAHDKTWNPGDYVPSVVIGLPDKSQSDVVARGGWLDGKWTLEMRRELITKADYIAAGVPPRPDDVQLVEGRHYLVRFTFYNATKTQTSQTEFLPLYLQPRH